MDQALARQVEWSNRTMVVVGLKRCERIWDQSRIRTELLWLQFRFAGEVILLLLGQKMILTRVRKKQSFCRWTRLSCLSLLGLFWASDAMRNCSAGDSAELAPEAFTNAQQILDLGIDKARSISAPAVITGVLTFPLPDRSWA